MRRTASLLRRWLAVPADGARRARPAWACSRPRARPRAS